MMNDEAQLYPAVNEGPLQRPTQTEGRAMDSMATRIGLSIVHRLGPRRVLIHPSFKHC